MLDTCVSAQCRSGLDILLRQAGGKIESRRGLPEKATTEGTPPDTPPLPLAPAVDVAMSKKSQKNNRRRSKRTARSSEGSNAGVLLGALMRQLPEVFEAEVLSKLDYKDHVNLALVNKECRARIYNLEPIAFMTSCLDDVDVDVYEDEYISLQKFQILRQVGVKGRLDVLKWLWNHGFQKVANDTTHMAARHGHKHVFDWIFALPGVKIIWTGRDYCTSPMIVMRHACDGAAEGGHLELLQYLIEKGCPHHVWKEACLSAPFGGHIHIMEWALAHGVKATAYGTMGCADAAQGGHLEALKWLRARKCPWDSLVPELAIEHGHHHILKWARDNGMGRFSITR